MAEILTGRETCTRVPTSFWSTTSFKVSVTRCRWGARARIPGGDSSTVIVPATAFQTSGSFDGVSTILTSEQKLKRFCGLANTCAATETFTVSRARSMVAGWVESPSAETSTRTTRASARSAVHPYTSNFPQPSASM